MKKIWKTRSEEGVSPVIATILMVAITVVLAAVLYVMVIGMTPGGDGTPPPGSVTFDVESSTSVRVNFGTFSPAPPPMAIKVIITNNSDAADTVELTFANAPDAGTIDMVATGGALATYTDMNYQGNAVNSGDFIIVDNLDPRTSYSVAIYHYPSDSVCTLAGDTSFNLP
jgi:flagellin-like protein